MGTTTHASGKHIALGAAALGAAALGTGWGLALRSQYERSHFVTERQVLCSAKLSQPRTLVFLTDLHDQVFGIDNAPLLAQIRAERPDAILIGGDMMVVKNEAVSLERTIHLLEELCAIAPVLYAFGNHESRLGWEPLRYGDAAQRLQQAAQQAGATVLRNRSVVLWDQVRVSGLELERDHYKIRGQKPLSAAELTHRLGPADKRCFQVLLAHTPVFAPTYFRWGAELTLCGHFHGGVVRLPGIGGLVTPQERWAHPYGEGTFWRGRRRCMIVGRGLGTHTLNVRLNDQAQLVVVQLLPRT